MRLALPLALVLLAFTSPARALPVEYDTGAICDTQNHAQRLAMLDADGEDTATINADEVGPKACAVATVAFVRGAVLGTAKNGVETIEVVEILVVGVDRGNGFQSVEPKVFFKLDKVDERDA